MVPRRLFINPSIKSQHPRHAINVSVEMIDVRRTRFDIGKGVQYLFWELWGPWQSFAELLNQRSGEKFLMVHPFQNT